MEAKEYVNVLIENSRIAQKEFETYSQEKVDEAVRAIGKAVFDNGEILARLAVDETKMGRYEDKIVKNKGKSKAVWNKLKGVKSRGILRYIEEEGLVEVGKPIGVIGAICPSTNPTMTPMQNAMIVLKGGNSLIVCPHPSGKISGKKTVDVMNEALTKIGAPKNLIQIVEEPSIEISKLVMELADVCISTGGPGMVKAAYSSGKPAFGVGPGNLQCLIDSDVDIKEVVPKVVKGRTYDRGVLCTCEQSAIIPVDQYDAYVAALIDQGAYYVEKEEELEALRTTMWQDGRVNRAVVGATPVTIAKLAGFVVPEDTKLLVVKIKGTGKEETLSREKMCPVLAVYSYSTWKEAVNIANTNLLNEGQGHSVVIHSNTKENIEYAAVVLPVSRFAVNQIGSSGLGGSFANGLKPTGTLGCGSWGNNSLSGNLWFNHLINTSLIAYEIPGKYVPTDDEIWN
ncbi:aldehyde dehydrogenase family protein [Clostridium sp.]|uniref:aldehyde dehydrogenase family protein n=1 Tax=Clostridium sp. TaxID=1506 RepID=UPI001A4EB7F3|nr:aldehyde dehydrogenase family protein [Clostridium sp.]MBK5240028.1 aldehyde dehydrogenase family protein [Clostridium sp.]